SPAMTTNLTKSMASTAKPHSGSPKFPSAVNQKRATRVRKSSFCASGVLPVRYSGSCFSHGLKVKYVHGFRATDKMIAGSNGWRTSTSPADTTARPQRARNAAPMPRNVPVTIRIDAPLPSWADYNAPDLTEGGGCLDGTWRVAGCSGRFSPNEEATVRHPME